MSYKAESDKHPEEDTNTMKRLLTLVALMALLLATSVVFAADTTATAELQTADGETVATATMIETDEGVLVSVEVTDAVEGAHGIHFHETGVCEGPKFESAGKHFNPGGAMHGLDNPEGPHAGDLPNLDVAGAGTYEATTDRVTLLEGETSLFDDDGTALIIHAMEDDQVTDPSGDSGDRIACGVVELVAGAPDTGGGGLEQGAPFETPGVLLLAAAVLSAVYVRRLAVR